MAESISGNGWSIRIDDNGVLSMLGDATPELDRQVGNVMRDLSHDIPAEIISRMKDYSPGRNATDRIQVRTGKLAQTVQGRRKNKGMETVVVVSAGSSTVPYARIQEYGGTIRPGPSKTYLRAPLPNILTDAGDVKGEFQLVERAGKWTTAGGVPTWISGRAIMVMSHGKATPIWALMTESRIPPRLGMRKVINGQREEIADKLAGAVRRSVTR